MWLFRCPVTTNVAGKVILLDTAALDLSEGVLMGPLNTLAFKLVLISYYEKVTILE